MPRRHVASWFDASGEERAELLGAIAIAREAILRRHQPGGFNIGVNVGAPAGQTVFHLHVHVIPRYAGDTPDPRGGVRLVIPARGNYLASNIISDQPERYDPLPVKAPAPEEPGTLDEATFAEKILTLLDEGVFTSTYKYAVLLALLDLCLEHTKKDGRPSDQLSTRALAEKVVEIYWPHTLPFEGRGVLMQNSGGQAEILSLITRFRERDGRDASRPIVASTRSAPKRYEALLQKVECKLIEMPLPRLQMVGEKEDPFIYPSPWERNRTIGARDLSSLERTIRLRAGVGEHLVRLSGLLRPLIQRQWARMIGSFKSNRDLVRDSKLEAFLFGVERISLDPVRAGLRELQNNSCFYCEGRLAGLSEVDHFIPWVRHPDNSIQNLVLTHPPCNSRKKDFLAASSHVTTWARRARNAASDLRMIAERNGWESDDDRSLAVARAIYLRLREDTQLWLRDREFVGANRGELEAALLGGDDAG